MLFATSFDSLPRTNRCGPPPTFRVILRHGHQAPRRMSVKQTTFEWQESAETEVPSKVVLETETTKTLIALMAHALMAVLCAVEQAEEQADER
jgi:hypothetical protein